MTACDVITVSTISRMLRVVAAVVIIILNQLCPTRGPRAACGPVEGFVRPSLGFAVVKVVYILTTCPYCDNL